MQAPHRGLAVAIVVALVGAFVLVGRAQNVGSGQVPVEPPTTPRDPARELAMKVTGSFTLASVGDVMIRRPASLLDEPAFQSAMKLLKDADIAVGNMEGNLADIPHFEGPLRGMMGAKRSPPTSKAMGFDMMNRANNHVFDADREGMHHDGRTAHGGGDRPCRHGQEPRGRACAAVSRHAEGPHRDCRHAHAERRPEPRGRERAGRQRRRTSRV